MSSLVAAHGVRIGYRHELADRVVLDGVDLVMEEGETVGLVGESGSGKSSLARALLGVLPRSATVEGTLAIGGVDMRADSRDARRARARDAGLIQQDPRASFNPVRRIGDSVTERLVHACGLGRKEAVERALEALAAMGIDDPPRRMRQYPHEFSGGMLQRVAIASVLIARPRLIIADEMTSALDVTTQAEVLALVRESQRTHGFGLLMITHDLDLAAAVCDRIVVLDRGVVAEECRGADLLTGEHEPYTRQLIESMPSRRRRVAVPGGRHEEEAS